MHSIECTMGITSPPEVGEEKVGLPIVSPSSVELLFDPIACDGLSLRAEIAPALDDRAVRAVRTCPVQAPHLEERRC
jgi:hypothetical protein